MQFRAARRHTLSFASGHSTWSPIVGNQPKWKTCHFLPPSKLCPALPQCPGLSSRKPGSDLHPEDKHITLLAWHFFRPRPTQAPSVAFLQGRGTLQHGCRLSLSLCLPLAACAPLGCCLFPADSCSPVTLSSLLPCWRSNCGHPDFSTCIHSPRSEPQLTGSQRKLKVQKAARTHPTSSRDYTVCNLACLWYTRRFPRKLEFVHRR